ncbi:MAG: sigma-70 family RNA polymerase sigma factor [Candidatus Curtissbacteria bacterium]|nr:sigma-70 family RNA polymerase sigma factor [Candidatus Curtissbacteria bacterium]
MSVLSSSSLGELFKLERQIMERQVHKPVDEPTTASLGRLDFSDLTSNRESVRQTDLEEIELGKLYMQQLSRFPTFPPDRTKTLFEHMGKNHTVADLRKDLSLKDWAREDDLVKIENVFAGSSTVRDVIANSNLGLAVYFANKYRGFIPYLDLIQAGNEGLMVAIDRYDLGCEANFSTYAEDWIKQRIRAAIVESKPIIPPIHVYYGVLRAKKMADEFQSAQGRYPSRAELQAHWLQNGGDRSTLNSVFELMRMRTGAVSSLEQTNDREATFDTREDSQEENRSKLRDVKRAVESGQLSQREQMVLLLIYEHSMTLSEAGEVVKVTRQGVGQIRKRALGKIRDNAESLLVAGD